MQREFHFWDLGEQWNKLVGLPFVYALWLIRPEVRDSKPLANACASYAMKISPTSISWSPKRKNSITIFVAAITGKTCVSALEKRKRKVCKLSEPMRKHRLLPTRNFTFDVV